MVAKPLEARELSLGELLSKATVPFQIPDYQRPFQWDQEVRGRNPINDLWEDLVEAAQHTKHHFFGTVLTTRESSHPGDTSPLLVLDGQQRLTTFALLLVALDRQLEEMEGSRVARSTKEKVRAARKRIRGVLFLNGDDSRRLHLRSEDNGAFSDVLGGGVGSGTVKRSFVTLSELLDTYLIDSTNQIKSLTDLLDACLDNAVLIHAHCHSKTFDPFVVFSTLNATGLPLTAAQVLRARCLGLVRDLDEMRTKEAQDAWTYVEKLAGGETDDPDHFLRDYLVVRTGARVAKDRLVRDFDKYAIETKKLARLSREDQSQHVKSFHSDLGGLARAWSPLREGKLPSALADSEWEASRVRLLIKELKLTQTLPLLSALAMKHPGEFAEVRSRLERAAFVAIVVLGNQTRWGDELFKMARDAFDGSFSAVEFSQRARAFFTEQLHEPVAKAFARRLPDELRYNGRKKAKLRYLLTALNDWGFPAAEPAKEPDDHKAWLLNAIHVDHICPRTGADPSIAQHDRDRLGNLTPLKGKVNSALSNRPFPEKRDLYRASPLHMTSTLAERETWTLDAVKAREKRMVEFAVKVFCRDL